MSEAEMNSYRFGPGKEPSDEMLADGAMVKQYSTNIPDWAKTLS